jgi:hypothetical protein
MALVKFNDVTLYWAFLTEKNDLSDKYQVDLCNLNDAQVEKLEDLGLVVRNKGDDRGNFLTAKSSKYPITPYTTSGDEIHEKVANGSKASVLFDTYEWNFKNKTGVSMGIKKLIVTDLIAYEAEVSEEDVEVL